MWSMSIANSENSTCLLIAFSSSDHLRNNGQYQRIHSWRLSSPPLARKSSWNVDCRVFFGRPRFLFPSAVIQSIAWLAGPSGAIRITCPANQNLLSFTVSCKRFWPVHVNTSVLVTLFSGAVLEENMGGGNAPSNRGAECGAPKVHGESRSRRHWVGWHMRRGVPSPAD